MEVLCNISDVSVEHSVRRDPSSDLYELSALSNDHAAHLPANSIRGRSAKPLVIGLGNELLTDDGFGIHVANGLLKDADTLGVDIVTSCLAGFSLMDMMHGRHDVLIIDSGMLVGMKPGEMRFYQDTDFAYTAHLYSQHQADLATVLAFGRELGVPLPRKVDLLLCGAADVVTLCEEMTPRVADAIAPALEMVRQWCERKISTKS